MFSAYEFTFAGESSADYGLLIYGFNGKDQEDVSYANKASIIESRTIGRVQPIHIGVNYHEDPLEFTLVFGSMEPLNRYRMQEIALWLTGHQDYQWLSIDQPDLNEVQFRCLVSELTPLSLSWVPYAFEATIICDCPYAYGYPFSETYQIKGEESILFCNDSSVREYLKPDLTIAITDGATDFSIRNLDDNEREFKFTEIPSSSKTIFVNNNAGLITSSDGINLYDKFNMNFFRLVRGDNRLLITGNGTVTISGRKLYNIGA